MAHKDPIDTTVSALDGHNGRTVIRKKSGLMRPFSRAPQSISVPPLPINRTPPRRGFQQDVLSKSGASDVGEDPEEAKICAVESRVSLQSAFALTVTMLPEPRSRRFTRSPPPIRNNNCSIMVTVDVEKVDDCGNGLPDSDAPAPHWPPAVNARRPSLGIGILRPGSCPAGRGSAYFDFDAATTNNGTRRICSPPPVPTTPKKAQTARGLVHKLSFARLKLTPSKSKENVSPARSCG